MWLSEQQCSASKNRTLKVIYTLTVTVAFADEKRDNVSIQ